MWFFRFVERLLSSVFSSLVYLIVLKFSLYYPLKAVIVERYCVNLVLSWNTLVSLSMVIQSFAGYRSLDWHLCSLSVSITSVQDLLAFIVSGEKSSVILIGLLLYVT